MSSEGNLIHCEAFYDTDTHRIVLHVPEELKPKDNEPVEPRKRGRPILYSSDEERKAKHREQALRHYYRKKALNQANNTNNDEVRLTISTHSKTLGDIAEDITFKRVNGRLRKQH